MSEKPKYNYQATAEIHLQIGSATNIHIAINGVGDTQKSAEELFDHALKSLPEMMNAGGVNKDEG